MKEENKEGVWGGQKGGRGDFVCPYEEKLSIKCI